MKKKVSIIKEKGLGEVRVIATPREVHHLKNSGFEVYVEAEAGIGIGIENYDYEKSGAIVLDTKDAWKASNFIIKYKPPTSDEFIYLNREKTICAVFHAEGDPELVERLIASNCTAYSYEFFRTPEGVFPLSVASSEIAGAISIIYGAYHLQTHLGGNGIFLPSVIDAHPAKVVVIGHGNAGGSAARLAARIGAHVVVLGRNKERLRAFRATMPPNTKCYENTPDALEREIVDADLVIGAILISTYDTPEILTRSMVEKMKRGSMIIDVTAGYGKGYMPTFHEPTSFQNPVYQKYGVLHCKIDVLPLAYSRTTVQAMSQHLMPYIINLGHSIYDKASNDPVSEAGKIIERGRIIHPELKRHMKFYRNE